jgi:prepilin-type N-terminal cleavage/methylation domain-containing protein
VFILMKNISGGRQTKRVTFREKFAKSVRSFRGYSQRGDSLIEVLLAMTILSIIAVGSILVMNRGNAIIQNALERTEVRAQVNTQTELLNYIHDNNSAEWKQIVALSNPNAPAQPINAASKCATTGTSFYIATSTQVHSSGLNTPSAPAVSASVLGTNALNAGNKASGIWIDAVRYPAGTSNGTSGAPQPYTDFYIKACWLPIGSANGSASSSITIVRIYGN